jgi:hypothetical protein
MSDNKDAAARQSGGLRDRVLNYSLRPAKNIERKMMAEAFPRLSPIQPLAKYRYVGFGSEFFNDFSLYHQSLGIRDMISIENDSERIERCRFNQPYKCIDIREGNAGVVLPQLKWSKPTIVWLDYISKLDKSIVADIGFVASQVVSGSVGIWTVNANPWGGDMDAETCEKVKASEWPERRLAKLRALFGGTRRFSDVNGAQLAQWGLAALFREVIVDEIQRALHDRNAGSAAADALEFRQCFHFRYRDGQRMLTVGGVFVNSGDAKKLGADPFGGLESIRTGQDSFEIAPPTLTGREVRFLNRLLPHEGEGMEKVGWLSDGELETFRQLYRYYPIFAESEL